MIVVAFIPRAAGQPADAARRRKGVYVDRRAWKRPQCRPRTTTSVRPRSLEEQRLLAWLIAAGELAYMFDYPTSCAAPA